MDNFGDSRGKLRRTDGKIKIQKYQKKLHHYILRGKINLPESKIMNIQYLEEVKENLNKTKLPIIGNVK